jgi:hypothetical protein
MNGTCSAGNRAQGCQILPRGVSAANAQIWMTRWQTGVGVLALLRRESCTARSPAVPDKEPPSADRWRFLSDGHDHMRPIPTHFISSAACVLALSLATGVCAQQAAPATAATTSHVDNTSVNQRDRSDQTLTPGDQPNDKADIKLAAAVRRAIVKDKSLSMAAHNVKLIAANGVVTLRGPAANADEKARLEADVRGVAGVSSVDNQLDVKTP